MTPSDAKTFIQKKRAGEDPIVENFTTKKGSGSEYSYEWITPLRNTLLKLKQNFPEVLGNKDKSGGKFEAEACVFVHQAIPKDFEAISDPEFWLYLSTVHFSDIIEWRHGTEEVKANLANYGIGGRMENLVYRMWLRSDIVYDKSEADPYALARIGDQDLWRSHILRQSYSSVRTIAKALIKFQYPAEKGRLSTDGIRELAKRLKRLRANVLFEYLSPLQIDNLIAAQAVNLPLSAKQK